MESMIVFCGGLRSSASTLQWQIACHLVESRNLGRGFILNRGHSLSDHWNSKDTAVIKTHRAPDDLRNSKALTTVRDLRDVVCSLEVRNNCGLEQAVNDLGAYVNEQESWMEHDPHLSYYEDLVLNLPEEVRAIASFLGINITDKEARTIASTYSLSRNRERLKKSHITDGEIGKYRGILSLEQIEEVNATFSEFLDKHRYTVDPMEARGYLKPEEREWLMATVRELEAATIANIGVQYGASMACFRAGAPKAEIYGIDINLSPYEGPRTVTLIKGRSQDPKVVSAVPPVEFAFIDGSHKGEDVFQDANIWSQKTEVIAFHDCLGGPAVHKIVNAAVEDWHDPDLWQEIPAAASTRAFRRVT